MREIEWYVWNDSGSTISALGRLWQAGKAQLFTIVADTSISSGNGVRRFRRIVPAASYGPYPPGTMLSLGMATPANKEAGINGVRVGFDRGAGRTGLLGTPVRVYDSRDTDGILTSGSTRTITLPTSAVQPGTAGIVANIMALGSSDQGWLTVFAANTPKPSITTLRYDAGQLISNTATVGISRVVRSRSTPRPRRMSSSTWWPRSPECRRGTDTPSRSVRPRRLCTSGSRCRPDDHRIV